MRNKPLLRPIPTDLHPDNPHRGRYDLPRLVQAEPALGPFVRPAPHGGETIDFADPDAVRALNRALIKAHYAIAGWNLPPGRLCPSIPGRADYLHHVAGLLDQPALSDTPIRMLDIGTGASAVYALIAARAFGWSIIASDIDAASLDNVRRILAANPDLVGQIELRRQADPGAILNGIIRPGEAVDLTVCNPPFHASAAAAHAGSERKWAGLGRVRASAKQPPTLNFGGIAAELWCAGGETAFISRLIQESRGFAAQVGWFTTLVSRADSLPRLDAQLRAARVHERRILDMRHGQKRSRILAWRFTASIKGAA